MRARFGGTWIADSEQILLLFEPGRYPVAYFPETDISSHVLAYNSLLGSGSGTRNRPIAPVESGPCCQDSPTTLSPG